MASKDVLDDIIFPLSDESLKKKLPQNPKGIVLGKFELRPGLNRGCACISHLGLLITLFGIQPPRRSNSFSGQHERAKGSTMTSDKIGSDNQDDPDQYKMIRWNDFVNCRLDNSVGKDGKQVLQLEIISFEVCGYTSKTHYRKRTKNVLKFVPISLSSEAELQSNWVDKILLASRRFMQKEYICRKTCSDEELLAKKRVLVLLNPVSGKRTALKTFHNEIGPFLNEAGIEFELFVTERVGHARERLQIEPLSNWDALLLVSGDGLLNEALNGLLSREDAIDAIQKPLGIIPCGSGNAIEGAILHFSREFFSPMNAAFVFIKGLYGSFQELDIGLCRQGDRHTFFCLAVNWGFSGDVDIESEVIRRIGEFRFVLGTLWRVMNRRIYRADVSYLPYTTDTKKMKSSLAVSPNPKPGTENKTDNEHTEIEISKTDTTETENITTPSPKPEDNDDKFWKHLQGPFTNIVATLCPLISHDLFIAPTHDLGCGYFTLVEMPYDTISRMQILKLMGNMKDDNMEGFALLNFIKVKAFRLTPIFPANGYLVVDGEVVPYEPCSGEISGHKMLITALYEK